MEAAAVLWAYIADGNGQTMVKKLMNKLILQRGFRRDFDILPATALSPSNSTP
jgi:hypothetical protein